MTDFTPLIVCLPMIIIAIFYYFKKPISKCISNYCKKRERENIIVERTNHNNFNNLYNNSHGGNYYAV